MSKDTGTAILFELPHKTNASNFEPITAISPNKSRLEATSLSTLIPLILQDNHEGRKRYV